MNYDDVTIKIPIYTPENGLKLEWEKDFFIKIQHEDGHIILSANEKGLRSLAKHFLCLANSKVPIHSHIHLDDSNSLEDGSVELIVEKI